MYYHYTVLRIKANVDRIIPEMFTAFHSNYHLLPTHWQARVEMNGGKMDDIARARVVCDYIAGMTDRFAILEHQRLTDASLGLK